MILKAAILWEFGNFPRKKGLDGKESESRSRHVDWKRSSRECQRGHEHARLARVRRLLTTKSGAGLNKVMSLNTENMKSVTAVDYRSKDTFKIFG